MPAFGSISRSTHRPTVVFPDPLSPTSPSASPGRMAKETPFTAVSSLPPLIGKRLTNPSILRTAAPSGDASEITAAGPSMAGTGSAALRFRSASRDAAAAFSNCRL